MSPHLSEAGSWSCFRGRTHSRDWLYPGSGACAPYVLRRQIGRVGEPQVRNESSQVGTVPKLAIQSWQKLLDLSEHLDVGDGITTPYMFRGHESATWQLEPTLHRAAKLGGLRALPDAEDLLIVEQAMTNRFKQAAPNHLPLGTLRSTKLDLEWWPIMRHYGAPTRLLDWTASLFVAAYFACRGEPKLDGAIYLVHVHTLGEVMKEIHGDVAALGLKDASVRESLGRPDVPAVVDLFERETALPQRMILQRGGFMLSRNVAADIETILTGAFSGRGDGTKEHFRKLLIPAAAKPRIMSRLRDFNVTGATLFPDLDGIGQSLEEAVRWRVIEGDK